MVSDTETGFHTFFALFEAWQDIFAINLLENGYFKIPLLCSKGKKTAYGFEKKWGWVNDDRILIFGWTIPLIWLSSLALSTGSDK